MTIAGRLQVDVARPLARGGSRSKAMRIAGIPASPMNSAYSDHSHAASTPTLTSVSIVAVAWRRFAQAARWKGSAPQMTTGVASVQRQPLPVVELQRRDHRQQQHRQRQRRRDEQPLAQRVAGVGSGVASPARAASPGSRRRRRRRRARPGATAAAS